MIDDLRTVVFVLSCSAVLVLLVRQFEKKWPVERDHSRDAVAGDWKVSLVNATIAFAMEPLTAACSVAIVNALGGGLIPLRFDGWWYVVSLIGIVLVGDLYRYASHRLQHAVPALWALHSFHHSAEALTFITGARHYWLLRVIDGAFLPVMAILFKIPADLAAIVTLIYILPDSCAHVNVRFHLGRAVTWLNSPQWHRIHHSTQPEHFNKNFSSLLPLWDIVFRTAWIPGKDEFPATGLLPRERVGVVDSIVWPFRHQVRKVLDSMLKNREVEGQRHSS